MSNKKTDIYDAVLVLSNGERFFGKSSSESNPVIAPITVITEFVGFQEHLYNQKNAGKIVLFTTPHIGITGANDADAQGKIAVAATLMRDPVRVYSNFRAERSLFEDLDRDQIPVLSGLDTRAISRSLGQKNLIAGVFTGKDLELTEAQQLSMINNFEGQGL